MILKQARRDLARGLWLRAHARSEKALAADLRAFFRAQHEAISDGLRQALADATPDDAASIIDQVYDPAEWDARLRAAVEPGLRRAALYGASAEAELTSKIPRKAAPRWEDDPLGIVMDVPRAAMEAIDRTLRENLAQPYWDELNRTTRRRMINAISGGIQNGSPIRDIVTSLDVVIDDPDRALLIARTECTSALNGGHHAVRQELIEEGLILGSEWSTVLDDVTRDSHAAADGQIAKGPKGLFTVGGHKTPYPGHHSLPASERVQCRCISLSGDTWAD
jgi:uncharacterized protein with gpF-like domain